MLTTLNYLTVKRDVTAEIVEKLEALGLKKAYLLRFRCHTPIQYLTPLNQCEHRREFNCIYRTFDVIKCDEIFSHYLHVVPTSLFWISQLKHLS